MVNQLIGAVGARRVKKGDGQPERCVRESAGSGRAWPTGWVLSQLFGRSRANQLTRGGMGDGSFDRRRLFRPVDRLVSGVQLGEAGRDGRVGLGRVSRSPARDRPAGFYLQLDQLFRPTGVVPGGSRLHRPSEGYFRTGLGGGLGASNPA